jgi:hypothetical protein
MLRGKSTQLKSTSTFWFSANSLQKESAAAAKPKFRASRKAVGQRLNVVSNTGETLHGLINLVRTLSAHFCGQLHSQKRQFVD